MSHVVLMVNLIENLIAIHVEGRHTGGGGNKDYIILFFMKEAD